MEKAGGMSAHGVHGALGPVAQLAPNCRRLSSRAFHSVRPLTSHAPELRRWCRSAVVEVCAAKGKKAQTKQMQSMQGSLPPTPPVDPDNVEFVIFVRAKKFPQWYPLSVVKGGQAANMLVKAMESELGRKLSGNSLVRNIGTVVYKERPKVEQMVRKTMPLLKSFKEFEYGFKIRDKENPKNWYQPENITVIPPEDELGSTVVDNVKNFFTGALKGVAQK